MKDIAGRAEQIFVVGKGLSKEGTKLLGEQLAAMSVGDLEAMLESNKADPFLVQQLVKDVMELARAIVGFLLHAIGQERQLFSAYNMNIFLSISFNIRCGCPKELSL